ncbi:beta-galactosidase [Datura stramonium]|uniref:beta-galactosidase n=1 Tax=Datura stramonium TaxID=4076 RepID=A0ABS8VNF6_DATST|nr:beta-galactosidase [Datura stramonium]
MIINGNRELLFSGSVHYPRSPPEMWHDIIRKAMKEAEWNQGGFPYWLREVPNITFRSYNEPFMHHMQKYAEMVISLMKKEKLFAPQGGPIIMAQIENEYNNVQLAYRDDGKYIAG